MSLSPPATPKGSSPQAARADTGVFGRPSRPSRTMALVRRFENGLTPFWLIVLAVVIGVGLGIALGFTPWPLVLVWPLAPLVLVAILALAQNVTWALMAVAGVIVVIPFAALPLNIGFNPTLLDLAIVAVYGIWLARLATRVQSDYHLSPLDLPLLGFIILACFSFAAGLGHAELTRDVARHFVEVLLAIGLVLVINNVLDRRDLLIQCIRFLLIAGMISATIGILLDLMPQNLATSLLSTLRIFQYPSGPGVIRFVEDNQDLYRRATALAIDPNALGGLLIMLAAITGAQLFAPRPVLPRIWIAAGLSLIGICLVLTFSRAAVLGTVVALGLIGWRYRRMWMLLLGGAILVLFLPQTQFFVQRFLEGAQGQDLATQMRYGEYEDALNLISRYPWFGVGFSGTPDPDTYIGVSSMYLLMAEEMGLVGLSSFLLVMAWFFLQSLAGLLRPDDPELDPILLGAVAAVAGAMVGGVLDHYFFNLDFPHSVTLFWLFVGLALAALRLKRQGNQTE
ncbi:MAG: O-antigen ligase family protein [Chloroflexi bacterium]|nr:O-antigen ligase family protein [Chloroflexota bacterium]